MLAENMDISVHFKGGGSFVKLRPVFSTDGENVFVSSNNSILEYNTKTGKFLHEYKGIKGNIVGFSFILIDDFESLIACSDSGHVIVWKVVFKIKIFEVQIHKEIKTFHLISFNLESGLEALISFKGKNEKFCVAITNLKLGKIGQICLKIDNNNYALDVRQKKYFSVAYENVVYFFNLKSFKLSRYDMAQNNRTFTCVSCHPEEEIVLTGDNTGRVLVWQDIFFKKTYSVFHWHTLPVNCLTFSASGSSFYSSAGECVLVKWQLDTVNSKQFLPRLPAALSHITVSDNNAYVAVATSDNAVRIIDARLNQINLIQHLVLGKHFECGILYDPITRALILNGNLGCVQFYSPNDMALLYNVDIVSQNKVTNERNCKIENTEIRKMALSKNGVWLATIEERKEKDDCKEIRLKFWNFSKEKQIYELNTSIEYPHDSSVNSVAFQPGSKGDDLKCVTVGNDRKFKIWQVTEIATVYKTGPIWKCLSVGFYRNLPCKSLSFSIDGSLFATGFEAIVTTWTPDSCDLKCSLIHPSYKGCVEFVEFGQGNQCHLLVAASNEQLSVWNLLNLTMVWIVNLSKISLLVADTLSTYMVVFCNKNNLFVFEPSCPNIIFSSNSLLNKEDEIVGATFIPGKYSNDSRLKWYERSNLYYITSESKLYCISKSEEPFEYEENNENLSEDLSLFSKMKAATSIKSAQVGLYKNHLFEKDTGQKTLKEYLEAPLLTLPPVRLQASSILKSFILQKEAVS